jgi:glycerol kinase
VAVGRLPAGVPLASQVGDSHAALYGQAGFHPGSIKATYGTGSSLMTPTPDLVHSTHGLSSTVAWASEGGTVYALEGNILATGAAVQWLGELLGLDDPAAGVAELATGVEDTGGVHLVPAFVGLGAPHWDDAARGLVSGLTRGTTAAHLARATLASIAHQVRDVFDLMQAEAGLGLEVLLADGGATRNDQLMQLQADLLGRPVLRTTSAEVSALGAAHLAGLAVGFWSSEQQLAALPRDRDRFEPRMSPSEREALHEGWQEAVARARWRKGES